MSDQLTKADVQDLIIRSRFHQMFRPEVLVVDNNELELVIKVLMCDQFERQPYTRQWHGGILASLVDIVGCYALMLITAHPMPTINFSTNFLKIAESKSLTAKGKVRKAGRTVGFVDVEVTDEKSDLVVVGSACYAIR